MNAKEQIENLEKQLKALRKKYYIKSFFRKAKRLVTDFLPLDSIPSEYCTERIRISEKQESELFLPKTFDTPQVSIKTPKNPIEIFALQNVLCIPNSTYFLDLKKEKLFYEKWHDDDRITYVYNTNNLMQHSMTLAKVKNHKNVYYDEEAIFLGGTFTFNYYHFLVDILSKVEFFQHIPDAKNKLIIVDEDVQKVENLKDLLMFFLKDYKILFLNHDKNYYQFKKLWHITSNNYAVPNIMPGMTYEAGFTKLSKSSLQYLRKTAFDNLDLAKVHIQPVKRIFISRRSQYRKYNEEEIFGLAQKHGFEEVFFEDLNIHEQIYLINNAEYIIGPSGAAWTNVLFANAGAKGLSWFSSVWGNFAIFSTLAKEVGFDLFFYIYPQDDEGFHEDYRLDPETFDKKLEQLLNT
ncbi:glycosyltransferase family 61 protein [Chryseobacterium sp. L7]|uniref:EGF domain-specific O-linked N-acetylglucosamine transferase n=1 Tax=Chryseobacterium endalhagicum TaxID=2797638 RepID=A0ABS1Q9I2_9FLAO|nr:glycosyltransferase family 61 protein [Chryseobacterium endalhagicum]MBL1219258.1 glycosyltransferase family 61 protein [Chryseobacterium endalhagicum]